MDRDKEPELQIVEIEPEPEPVSDIVIRYQILNERLNAILHRIQQRKPKTSN